MHALNQRLIAEWQELDITYPLWLTHVVMDEVYYTATLVVACVACFEMGMIIGMIVTVV